MKKRILSALLVVAMILSMVPVSIAADTVKYVSLGDSMTNGYGLPGYDGENGCFDYGTESYANQFAAWLESTGKTVEHTQLAMSAMRAEDLHWLLELDYEDAAAIALTDGAWDEAAWNAMFTTGDYWTWNELCDDYRFAQAAYSIQNSGSVSGKVYTGEAAIVAEAYQTAVKEADVISLGIGNGNFGVFMLGRIMEAIGFNGTTPADAMIYNVERALAECDPELQAYALSLKEELHATMEEYVAEFIGEAPAETVEALINTVVYTGVSFVLNYAGTVEAILQLNPDAEIVLVALMNTFANAADGGEDTIGMGELLSYIFDPLNVYIAALPTVMQLVGNGTYADATFYYAEAEGVECMVEVYDEVIATDPTGTLRQRFVRDIVGTSSKPGMVWALLSSATLPGGLSLTTVELSDVVSYAAMDDEAKINALLNADPTTLSKLVSAAVYLAVEKAAVAASAGQPIGMNTLMSLGGSINPSLFGGVMVAFEDNAASMGAAYGEAVTGEVMPLIYQGVAAYMTALGTPVDAATVEAAYVNEAHPMHAAAKTAVDDTLATYADEISLVCTALVIPDALSAAMLNDGFIAGLMGLFGRCMLGNGVGGHPSANGHTAVKNAVVKAYSEKYTAADKTFENVAAALEFAYEYIVANYETVYAKAYEIAEAQGYIAAADGYLAAAAAAVEALDVESLTVSAELKAELNALKAEVLEDVAALRAFIASADHAEAVADFWTVLAELEDNMTALAKVCEQAGSDAAHQLETLKGQIFTQLNTAHDQASEAVIEQLGTAYEMIKEALIAQAGVLDKLAGEKFEEYVGQNPTEFVESIKIYGYDIDTFLNYWGRYAELLLGPAWDAYGEDVIAILEENAAKLMAALQAKAEVLGNDAAEALAGYVAELQIVENFTAIAEQLKNGALDLGASTLSELEAIATELNNSLTINADNAVKALEDLAKVAEDAAKPIIDSAIAEIRATESDRIDAVNTILNDVYTAQATVEAALTDVENVIAAALILEAMLADPTALDFEETSGAVQFLLTELTDAAATVGAVAEQFHALDAATAAAAAAVEAEFAAAALATEKALKAAESTQANAAAAAVALLDAAKIAAETYVNSTAQKITGDVAELIAICEYELNNILFEVAFEALFTYYDAISGYYPITCVSSYVALGNADYAADLAAALNLTEKFTQLALEEASLAELAGADLITVKFDNGEFMQFAASQIMGMAAGVIRNNEKLMGLMNGMAGPAIRETLAGYGLDIDAQAAELDWSLYLDEKAQGVLAETLANVRTIAVEEGIPEVYIFDLGAELADPSILGFDPDIKVEIPVADLTVAILENVLYGYASFATNFADTLNAIHVAAPKAEVVVTGIENPAEGAVLEIAGMQIDLTPYAQYAQYAVDALNIHLYTYAVLNGETTTFVENATVDAILEAVFAYEYGHEWSDWTVDGDNHIRVCELCGEPETTGCIWDDGVVTKPAECGVAGEKTFTCSAEPGHTRTEPIPALQHTDSDGNYSCDYCGTSMGTPPVTPDPTPDPTPTPGGSIIVNREWTCNGGYKCACKAFTDVKASEWYHNAICYSYYKNLMVGMSETKFEPNTTTNRAMIVMTLYRMEGSPKVNATSTYSDVKAGEWYHDAIVWATQKGIVEGYGNGKFGPKDTVTREQIATILYRYAKYERISVRRASKLEGYTDVKEISDWALDAMKWANAVGLIEGRTTTTLNPKEGTKRSELATLLMRWCEDVR